MNRRTEAESRLESWSLSILNTRPSGTPSNTHLECIDKQSPAADQVFKHGSLGKYSHSHTTLTFMLKTWSLAKTPPRTLCRHLHLKCARHSTSGAKIQVKILPHREILQNSEKVLKIRYHVSYLVKKKLRYSQYMFLNKWFQHLLREKILGT